LTCRSLEQQLLDILKATNAEQRSVLELLEQQHEAMIQRDLTRLSELATSLVSRAESLQKLEQQRSAVTQQLSATRDDLGAQPTLQEIAAGASSPVHHERMLDLRDHLLETQDAVATARDRNQTLASHVLEANDATLRNLMVALRESGDRPDDRPRVLDRRA
jgi:hypothetical protein